MCKFEDIIDKSPLAELIRLISEDKSNEYIVLLTTFQRPKVEDEKFVSLGGWRFNAEGMTYEAATPNNILGGWDILLKNNIPLNLYTNALCISSIFTWLNHNSANNLEIDKETDINNLIEPEISELLRMCYWIFKCNESMEKGNFESKLDGVVESLQFSKEHEFRKSFKETLLYYSGVMKDPGIKFNTRLKYANQLLEQLKPIRARLSSVVPEFMVACLACQEGYNARFIPATTSKSPDLSIESYLAEIKTFLDTAEEGRNVEETLRLELNGTMKRQKTICDINDALLKKAEMVLVFLTFSSLAVGFAKYTYEKSIAFPFSKALSQALDLAKRNRNESAVSRVPVLAITTLINIIDCKYKIFSHMVPYPVRIKGDNTLEVDNEKLSREFFDVQTTSSVTR